jgi:2-keto-4-pentenoate hydratase/2-oxohepta-3-ene-1,7-dioic acid hydratase in catechol pathway
MFVADGDIIEATIEGVGSVTVPISGNDGSEEAE